MKEFELECHKLGIPVTTRHNEVAPNQFECAVFEEANLANDHNLLMEVMEQVARKHNFRVLLHEKPQGSTARASTTTGPSAPTPG